MYKKLKKVIGYYLNKENKIYSKNSLCGVELKTLPHTIRTKTDQDDAWYFALVQHSERVFDLGCNIGYMSLLAAIQKINTNIVLVDPNPEALAKAAQNMIINGFGIKSKFISAFIGDNNGEKIKFYTIGAGEAGSMFSSHAETAAAVGSFYEVEKLTIDRLVEKVGFIPDLIKIDVEGAESLALLGAVKVAEKQITKMFVEMHAPKELPMKQNAELVMRWCVENHYKAFYLKEMAELTNSDTIAKRGKCHLLLLPKNENLPEYLKNINQGDSLPQVIN